MNPVVEHDCDVYGVYHRVWLCEPPTAGQRFQVTRQEWNKDLSIQKIYSWEPVDT